MKDVLIKLLGYFLLVAIFASLFRNPAIGFLLGIILILAFKFWK